MRTCDSSRRGRQGCNGLPLMFYAGFKEIKTYIYIWENIMRKIRQKTKIKGQRKYNLCEAFAFGGCFLLLLLLRMEWEGSAGGGGGGVCSGGWTDGRMDRWSVDGRWHWMVFFVGGVSLQAPKKGTQHVHEYPGLHYTTTAHICRQSCRLSLFFFLFFFLVTVLSCLL